MGPTAGVRRRRSWSFAVALSIAVLACVFFLRREASILLTLSSPWRSTDNHSPPGTLSKDAKKLRPYDASRPPRVAVCLTGGIRTMRFTMPSIAHNLVDALQPDRGLRHVFIETTTKPDCLSNLNNLALYDDCLIQFNATRRWLDDGAVIAKLLGSNVSIHIENELRCQHPFLLDQPCCMKDARAMDDCGVGLLGMAQFVRRRLCYKRITDYEALHGENFDLVVFSRSDMHFLEPVPPAETFLRKPSRVYFMTKGDAWADFFFVVPRTLSAAFDEASDNVNTDRCSGREDRDKSPEYVLGPWVEKHMEHQLYPFHGVIVRSETRAECGRLGSGVGNDINSVGRYLDEVNNTLVGIDARCRAVYPLGMPPMVQRHSNSGWYFIVAAVASAVLFFAVLLHRRYRSRAAH